jgi:hypothetical protein
MQSRRTFRFLRLGLAAAAMLSLPAALVAQQPTAQDSHIVSPAQLQQQMQSASAARQKHIDTLTGFLSTSMAVRAMKSRGIDPVQVKNAIPNLSNAELASLSARATRAQQDFAAGNLSNNTLLIIILVLVAVILIAVIR